MLITTPGTDSTASSSMIEIYSLLELIQICEQRRQTKNKLLRDLTIFKDRIVREFHDFFAP
jgi:hypothetical protein